MKFLASNIKWFLIASLTLGLAPFTPPHIVGKLQWIAGGGAIHGEQPMQMMDWLDLAFHGTPWLLLILATIALVIQKLKSKPIS